MLTLDGTRGEGGGQILRTALTLACLTGMPLRLERIRAGRAKPGLRPQHLTAVRAAAAICAAQLTGDAVGSQTLTFTPTTAPLPGDYFFDVADAASGGSAGAVTLILQTLLLPLALAAGPSRVRLRGGTFVPWSPPAPYVMQVYLPMLAQLGIEVSCAHPRWGLYPRGGGTLVAEIPGGATWHTPPWEARGPLQAVTGIAFVANLPSHIPQRMSDRARTLLHQAGLAGQIEPQHVPADGPGAGIFLHARYAHAQAGFCAWGRKGLPAEEVAASACAQLVAYHRSEALLDPHLADQLVLPLTLAGSACILTVSKITQHLLTNVETVRLFGLQAPRVVG
ncbi:MAG TPA: RNA 3'-phosphate cyclase, partial [Chloroflexi bacterium]|nr:RNA 3'-phosphate cyclase [Chloroflexota bacterium]